MDNNKTFMVVYAPSNTRSVSAQPFSSKRMISEFKEPYWGNGINSSSLEALEMWMKHAEPGDSQYIEFNDGMRTLVFREV